VIENAQHSEDERRAASEVDLPLPQEFFDFPVEYGHVRLSFIIFQQSS
jgi:hypothetical protein